jgi:hypothetical protein
MRRWDRLIDGYLEEYAGRGRSAGMEARVAYILGRWGRWMKRGRPRIRLERVDPDLRVWTTSVGAGKRFINASFRFPAVAR